MVGKARVQKRLYYKIGEACKALGIQPYVLRYWETEFPALAPSKSRSGQRVYSEKELEIIRRIKELLYGEGYTIAGAKKKLETELATGTLGDPEDGEPQQEETAAPAAPRGSARTAPSRKPKAQDAAPAPLEPPPALPEPELPGETFLLEEEPEDGSVLFTPRLDTDTAERIQTLRSGIARALDEAREILVLLEKPR